MRLAERFDAIRTALELFPRCSRCGADLSGERLAGLVVDAETPTRFAHAHCPALVSPPALAGEETT